ncbi:MULTISPECIES: TetR/AcrR family transcriptional regulator [unclassified Streptomyces]|uniref:TetR/AcrR family transcriptional regulator n=1 Tax=unclassified Streptomyces TaxID=2593676 RepID=UPI000CDAA267|nr:TetR/AcrR family transcriptional regulator [Streptomyces sp. SM10]
MSPKQLRGEVTSDLLLDAALRVFVESGEQGLTVNAVIRASGVSLGSLYHHFGSLDGLIGTLGHRWLGRLLGGLAEAMQGAGTARAGIAGVVDAYLAFVREHPGPALLLHSPLADRKGMAQGKELRDAQEARVSAMGSWVALYVDSGELAPLPLPLIESLVLGPVVAVARRSLSGIDDVDLDEAARLLPEQIWRSVRA